MIIYNVTVNIDHSVHLDWLKWMKEVHIPDVMRTGIFTESRMLRVLGDEDSGGCTYSVQYTCHGLDDFKRYEETYAAKLRAGHSERYRDKFVSFSTLLETVD